MMGGQLIFRLLKIALPFYIHFKGVHGNVDDSDLFPFDPESSGSSRIFYYYHQYCQEVKLGNEFKFLNVSYTSVFPSLNGFITFGQGSNSTRHKCNATETSTPTLSVFMAEPKWRTFNSSASLTYKQESAKLSLDKVSADIYMAFPHPKRDIKLSWMLILTWYNVQPWNDIDNSWANTFQAILTSDGSDSFVVLYYNKICWPNTYNPAEAGIYDGLGNSYLIQGSCNYSLTSSITEMSNIGIPGKFVFRVDETVQTPSKSYAQKLYFSLNAFLYFFLLLLLK